MPTSPKYVLALPWEIWSELSTQYLRVNESLNSYKTTGSYCLDNRQTCSKLHRLYTTCSKCLPPAWTQSLRHWRHVANEQSDSDCSLVDDASSQFVDFWDLSTRRQTGHTLWQLTIAELCQSRLRLWHGRRAWPQPEVASKLSRLNATIFRAEMV